MNNFVKGVPGYDVSFYQDNDQTPQKIDFVKMKASGAGFVICRAGQNLWIDEDVRDYWLAARLAGLPRAAYWFYDPRIDPIIQADLFCGLFVNDRPEGRLWLDLEFPDSWGGAFKDWTHWKRCIERIKANGFRVGVYTGNWWWQPNAVMKGADLSYFAQFPLWASYYIADPADVVLPRGWNMTMIWQDGTPSIGLEVGVESREIDHNFWNTRYDFVAEWGTVPTLPPPTGENMEYKVVWSGGVARRTAPTTSGSSTNLPAYPLNSVVQVVQDNIPDTTDPTNVNKRWVKFADGLYGASNYPNSIGVPQVRMVKIEAPAPAPTRKPFTLTVDGFKPYSGELEPL